MYHVCIKALKIITPKFWRVVYGENFQNLSIVTTYFHGFNIYLVPIFVVFVQFGLYFRFVFN